MVTHSAMSSGLEHYKLCGARVAVQPRRHKMQGCEFVGGGGPMKALPAGLSRVCAPVKAGPRKSEAYCAVSRSNALLSSLTGDRRKNPYLYPFVETQLIVLYAGHGNT
jgi:hypothetical protein